MTILRSIIALVALGCIAASSPLKAQKEFNIWCFGDGVGIDFNTPTPTLFSTAINSLEGSASIADPTTGALLFYTDGEKVYNRNHAVMPNGSGLFGHLHSTQSSLIVPMPGERMKYYLFTSDAGLTDSLPKEGICYSIVDMTEDNGLGAVTTKNIQLLNPAAEKLIAVRHRDGCGYWILAHGWNDSKFHAWLVNGLGISAPVISDVGAVHADRPGREVGSGAVGAMKISPDGRRLAVATFMSGTMEIFSFDNGNGRVSDPIPLTVAGDPYGLSFSPDNSKLYISSNRNTLYQFDLANPDPASIAASGVIITEAIDSSIYDRYAALQLAPDGKIYHARLPSRWLAAIRNPNAKGPACDYVVDGIDLGAIGRRARLGLPNLIDSYFASGNLLCGIPMANFTPGDTVICAGDCVDFIDRSTNQPTAWLWTFQGTDQAGSTEQNPSGICFMTPGSYRVLLTASNALGGSTTVRWFEVLPPGDLRAHMDRSYTADPGDTVIIPLMLDAPIDAARLGEMTLSFRYRPGVLLLDTIEFDKTLLEGWRLDSYQSDPISGHCIVRIVSSDPARILQGTGALARLIFRAFLGDSDTSEIHYDLSSGQQRCLSSLAGPGLVRITGCGVEQRLIRFDDATFALDGNRPDPFNPSTLIPFSIGAECHARLTIHDALGRTVATLVDAPMQPGSYTIRWDASSFPSGLYYYRLTAGEWMETRRMVVEK